MPAHPDLEELTIRGQSFAGIVEGEVVESESISFLRQRDTCRTYAFVRVALRSHLDDDLIWRQEKIELFQQHRFVALDERYAAVTDRIETHYVEGFDDVRGGVLHVRVRSSLVRSSTKQEFIGKYFFVVGQDWLSCEAGAWFFRRSLAESTHVKQYIGRLQLNLRRAQVQPGIALCALKERAKRPFRSAPTASLIIAQTSDSPVIGPPTLDRALDLFAR